MPLTKFKLSSIADGGISTAKLADNAVTIAKTSNLFVNTEISGTEAAKMPVGTTAQRANEKTGDQRFNSTTSLMEYYDGTQWKAIDAPPIVSSINPTDIASASGGTTTITLTGSNFQSGLTIKAIANDTTEITASVSTQVSSTTSTAVFTDSDFDNTKEPYDIRVTNPSNLSATLENVLYVDNEPTWSTNAGNLGTIQHDDTGTHFTVSATDADSDTVVYSETTSILSGAGISLNSSTGALSGDPTDPTHGATDNYSFTLRATANSKTTDRAFNINVYRDPVVDSGGGAGWHADASDATAGVKSSGSQTTYYADAQQASPNNPGGQWSYGWSQSAFNIHSGHAGVWPHYTAVQLSTTTPVVCDYYDWIKHTNACGNFDIYGSNQSITSSNFTTLSNWTRIGRGHGGGSGSATDGTVMNGSFNTNQYGYRWMMFVIRDGASTVYAYPSTSVGALNAYAMYASRVGKS